MSKDWTYQKFLERADADRFYQCMLKGEWRTKKGEHAAIHYGVSYQRGGGERPHTIPLPPKFILELAKDVSALTNHPVNYIQAHRFAPAHSVRPHEDPRGMCVPMLVLGQQRTFRVGGTLDLPRSVPQDEREVSWHKPAEEILLEHGSLLVFNGGRVVHSMYPAAQDKSFTPLGFDYRISLLFRWTTNSMREFGPGPRASQLEYDRAVYAFQKQSPQPEPYDPPPFADEPTDDGNARDTAPHAKHE